MSGINDKRHFHSPVSNNAGHGQKSHQPEVDVQAPLEQATVRHESKSPDDIFKALSKSGSSAQLGVLAARVQAGFEHFPSPTKFAELEKKIRAEFPNISDSALSGVAADLLIGKVAVNV